MNSEGVLPREDHQGSFALWDPREVCERIGLQWWAAVGLAADGYLSYDPSKSERLDSAQEAELLFVGSIAATDCERRMLDGLLAGLEKPYCFRHDRIRYDWQHGQWVAIAQPEDTVEEGYERLKRLRGPAADERLRAFQESVTTDFIESLRENDDQDGLQSLADQIEAAMEPAEEEPAESQSLFPDRGTTQAP